MGSKPAKFGGLTCRVPGGLSLLAILRRPDLLSLAMRKTSLSDAEENDFDATCYGRPYYRLPPGRVSRMRGCLLAGALGDALGAPVEFLSLHQIREEFGPEGICQPEESYGRIGAVTDDTQMTLFTAEGLLRAHVLSALRGSGSFEGCVNHAYLRWLHTQGVQGSVDVEPRDGILLKCQELHAQRAPGHTCITALRSRSGKGDTARAVNDSKGCGGVMRAAPVGLYLSGANADNRRVFELGCKSAALTHGHPTGQHPAGALAVMVAEALRGKSLHDAADCALEQVRSVSDSEETQKAMVRAVQFATSTHSAEECLVELGQGWIAEEALAIGLFCALRATSLAEGLLMAVNITGDSDSTGSIAGNLLGAERGVHEIPETWLRVLELRGLITEVADDLCSADQWQLGERVPPEEQGSAAYWVERYPGS